MTLAGAEETRLIGLGYAVTDLDGPGNTPLPVTSTTNLTGVSTFLVAGESVLDVLDGAVVSQDPAVKALLPIDYIAHEIFSTDGTYLFGRDSASTSKIYRVPVGQRTGVTGVNACAGGALSSVISTETPGLLFTYTGAGGGNWYLYRSTNYGDTWVQVLQFGTGAGGSIVDVRLLSDRGFCEVVLGGVRTFFVGEYNVNGSRTPGAANDLVVLWKSVDLGLTWSVAARWNANGSSTNVRHIHAVRKDPYTDRIYICVGDSDAESGMVSWDGVTAIPDNTSLSAITQSTGLSSVYGRQRYRACDLLFDDSTMFWLSDSPADSSSYLSGAAQECGWWASDKDFSNTRRLGASILERAGSGPRGGFFGAMTASGSMVWVDDAPSSAVTNDTAFSVYHTNTGRTKEARVGKVQLHSTTGLSTVGQVCVAGDYIYIGTRGGLGKAAGCTTVVQISDIDFVAPKPDTLHPVYWADPVNGLDANSGLTPDLPWKTLTYALTGSRVTRGGKIQYPEVTYLAEPAHTVATALSATGADVAEFVTIAGEGASKTKLFLADGAEVAFIRWGDFIETQDIHIGSSDLTDGVSIFSGGNYSTVPILRVIRSIIGNIGAVSVCPVNAKVNGAGPVKVFAYDSVLCSRPSGSLGVLDDNAIGTAPRNYYLERCTLIGGKWQVRLLNDASTLTYLDTDFIDPNSTGAHIAIPSTAAALPSGRRGRFLSTSSVAQLTYAGALTPAGEFKSAKSNRAFSPALLFDAQSEIIAIAPLTNDIIENPRNVLVP